MKLGEEEKYFPSQKISRISRRTKPLN